ncbi:hypothetical protein Droror1_Dr00013183 [Drosera rotundifolia]
MKKEEQESLGEEGAAIAEAVALQVLIGEDLLDSWEHAVDKDDELNSWYSAGRVDLLMGSSEFGSSSSQEALLIPISKHGVDPKRLLIRFEIELPSKVIPHLQQVFMIEAFIGQAYKMLEKAFP